MDLKAEIQGAFQEIILPQMRKDLSSLKQDVQDMRSDLQLLSSLVPMRTSGDDRSGDQSVPPRALDAVVELGQDHIGHTAGGDPAQQGQPSSQSWKLRAARALSKTKGINNLVASTTSNKHQVQHLVPPNYIADVTESTDDGNDNIEREGSNVVDFTGTNGKDVSSTSFTVIVPPPSEPESNRINRKTSPGRMMHGRQDRAMYDSDGSPTSLRERVTDLQVSSEARSASPIIEKMKTRQSLAAGRVSLALARQSEAAAEQTPLIKWLLSLTQRNTYQGLTAKTILQSSRFDNVISFLILGNSLTIGLEADYAVTHAVPWPYRFFEIFFCVVFTSEVVLRVWVHRVSFFCSGSGSRVLWNYFDLLVVGAQLVQECIELLKSNASDQNDAANLRILRILRVLRIVRIFRLVRVLHLISELRTIVSSIMGSFRSLFWTVILLLLVMYVVGVWFLQSVTDHFIERSDVDSDGDYIAYSNGETQLRKHFDSLAQTILSLWQALRGRRLERGRRPADLGGRAPARHRLRRLHRLCAPGADERGHRRLCSDRAPQR